MRYQRNLPAFFGLAACSLGGTTRSIAPRKRTDLDVGIVTRAARQVKLIGAPSALPYRTFEIGPSLSRLKRLRRGALARSLLVLPAEQAIF